MDDVFDDGSSEDEINRSVLKFNESVIKSDSKFVNEANSLDKNIEVSTIMNDYTETVQKSSETNKKATNEVFYPVLKDAKV